MRAGKFKIFTDSHPTFIVIVIAFFVLLLFSLIKTWFSYTGFAVIGTPPSVNLLNPADGSSYEFENNLNFEASASDPTLLVNVSFWTDSSGSWQKMWSKSLSSATADEVYTWENIPDGTHMWGFKFCDNDGNCVTKNRTITMNYKCEPGGMGLVCFRNDFDTNIANPVRAIDLYSEDTNTNFDSQGMALMHYRGSQMYLERDAVWYYRAGVGRIYFSPYGAIFTGAMRYSCSDNKKYRWQPDKIQYRCSNNNPSKSDIEIEVAPVSKYSFLMKARIKCTDPSGCSSPERMNYLYSKPSTTHTTDYMTNIQGYHGLKIWTDKSTGLANRSLDTTFYLAVDKTPDDYEVVNGEYRLKWSLAYGESMDIISVLVTDNELSMVDDYLQNADQYFDQATQNVENYMNMFKYPSDASSAWEKKRYYYAIYDFWYNTLGPIDGKPSYWNNEILKPGANYNGIWIWDSFFGAWAFASGCRDGNSACFDIPRNWLRTFIDNKYSSGQWPREIWDSKLGAGWQAPGGWPFAIWQLHLRDPDTQYLCEVYPELKAYHEWVLDNKDQDNDYRFIWSGTDSGWDGSARWEPNGNEESLDLQGWMIVGAESLKNMAEICRPSDVSLWNTRITNYKNAASGMWQNNMFWDLTEDTDSPADDGLGPTLSAAIYFMMFSDVSSSSQDSYLVSELHNSNTLGPDPTHNTGILPTISRSDHDFDPNADSQTWSGSNWININLVTYLGLMRKGLHSEADYIKGYTINQLKEGQIGYEAYNSVTGEKVTGRFGGWPYIWSDTAYIAMMQNWDPFGASAVSIPLDTPTITSPDDNSLIPTDFILLTYNAAGATSYTIYGDTNSNPTTQIYQGLGTSFNWSGLTPGQTYFVKVSATNGTSTKVSSINSYQIETNQNIDLDIEQVTYPAVTSLPSNLQITASIRNTGNSVDVYTKFEIDSATVCESSSTINPGLNTVSCTYPATEGYHLLKVTVDSNDQVAELSETNNEDVSDMLLSFHPRLLFSSGDRDSILQNVSTVDSFLKPRYDSLLSLAYGRDDFSTCCNGYALSSIIWTKPYHASQIGLAYQFTKDSALAAKAKSYLMGFCSYDAADWKSQDIHARGHAWGQLALLYDYIAETLTPAEKSQVVQCFYDNVITNEADDIDDYDGLYQVSNGVAAIRSGFCLAHLAVLSEYDQNPGLEPYWSVCKEVMQGYLGGYMNSSMVPDGLGYYNYALTAFIPFLEAYRRNIDSSIIDDYNATVCDWWSVPVYGIMDTKFNAQTRGYSNEDYMRFFDFDDSPEFQFVSPNILTYVATRCNNPVAQWFVHMQSPLEQNTRANSYFSDNTPEDLIFYNKALQPKTPKEADIPLTKEWTNFGRVTMRTGWEDNDIAFSMHSGDDYGWHHHSAENGIVLYKGDYLIVDPGIQRYWPYTNQEYTVGECGHNTLVVDQRCGTHDDDGDSAPQDGSQQRGYDYYLNTSTCNYPNCQYSPYASGRITELFSSKSYDTTIGDAGTYDYYNLDKYTRDVVFMRPKYFVIRDSISPESGSHSYDLHFTHYGTATADSATNSITIQEGDANALVRVLVPSSVNVNANFFSFNKMISSNTEGPKTMYVSKLGVGVTSADTDFVTVIYPYMDSEGNPPAISSVDTGDIIGAVVSEADGDEYTLWSKSQSGINYLNINSDSSKLSIKGFPGLQKNELKQFALNSGKSLQLGADTILSSDNDLTVSAVYETGNVSAEIRTSSTTSVAIDTHTITSGSIAIEVDGEAFSPANYVYDYNQKTVTLSLDSGSHEIFMTGQGDGAPYVTLTNPTDSASFTTNEISLNCEASDDYAVSSLEIYSDRTGSWSQEYSILGSTNTLSASKALTFADGTYTWNCHAVDNASQSGWGSNRTFTVYTAPPATFNYYAANTTNESAYIYWTSDIDADSTVHYSINKNSLTDVVTSATLVRSHSVYISELNNNTLYYYQIQSCNSNGCSDGNASLGNFTTNKTYVDTTSPVVSFVSPTPENNAVYGYEDLTINFTCNDLNPEKGVLMWNGVNEKVIFHDGTQFWQFKNGLTEGTYSFNVTCNDSSSNMGASETRTINISLVVNPFCGDNICNNGETCETCVGDCDVCPETNNANSGGGGSGGSGSNYPDFPTGEATGETGNSGNETGAASNSNSGAGESTGSKNTNRRKYDNIEADLEQPSSTNSKENRVNELLTNIEKGKSLSANEKAQLEDENTFLGSGSNWILFILIALGTGAGIFVLITQMITPKMNEKEQKLLDDETFEVPKFLEIIEGNRNGATLIELSNRLHRPIREIKDMTDFLESEHLVEVHGKTIKSTRY